MDIKIGDVSSRAPGAGRGLAAPQTGRISGQAPSEQRRITPDSRFKDATQEPSSSSEARSPRVNMTSPFLEGVGGRLGPGNSTPNSNRGPAGQGNTQRLPFRPFQMQTSSGDARPAPRSNSPSFDNNRRPNQAPRFNSPSFDNRRPSQGAARLGMPPRFGTSGSQRVLGQRRGGDESPSYTKRPRRQRMGSEALADSMLDEPEAPEDSEVTLENYLSKAGSSHPLGINDYYSSQERLPFTTFRLPEE